MNVDFDVNKRGVIFFEQTSLTFHDLCRHRPRKVKGNIK